MNKNGLGRHERKHLVPWSDAEIVEMRQRRHRRDVDHIVEAVRKRMIERRTLG